MSEAQIYVTQNEILLTALLSSFHVPQCLLHMSRLLDHTSFFSLEFL